MLLFVVSTLTAGTQHLFHQRELIENASQGGKKNPNERRFVSAAAEASALIYNYPLVGTTSYQAYLFP